MPIKFLNNVSVDQDVLYVDGINNRVGIGTTSPGEKLSVAPNTDVSAEIGQAHIGQVGFNDYAGFSHVDQNTQQGYALLQSSDGSTFMNANTAKAIRFRIANSDKMILDSLGNVGIGTTGPGAKLDVNGDLKANTYASIQGIDSGNPTAAANELRVSGYGIMGNRSSLYFTNSNTSGNIQFGIGGAHSAGTKMQINSSGNVGIGTTDPAAKLHLFKTENNFDAIFKIQYDAYNVFGIPLGTFDAFTIDSSARVGIGTDSPAYKLDVNGYIAADRYVDTDNASFYLEPGSGATGQWKLQTPSGYVNIGPNNSSYCHFYTDRSSYYFDKKIVVDTGVISSYNEDLTLQAPSGSTRMVIDSSTGNVGIGTTSPSHPLTIVSSYPQIKIQQTGQTPSFTFGSGSGFAVFDGVGTSGALLDIRDDGTSRMRIDAGGNVGIGTTSPGEKLEVSGNIKTTQTVTQGTTVTFTKPNNSTTYETIATNIAITRGSNGAIYNPLLEDAWNSTGTPSGLLFNIGDGWSDLSDIATRTYVTFGKLWDYGIGQYIVNEELVMWDYLNNEYHKIKFTSWTAGGGGGFVYQRTPLTLTENKVSTDVLDVNHQLNLYGPVKAKNRIEFDVDVDWTEGAESNSYYLNSKLLVDPVLNNVKIGRNVGYTTSAGSINNYDNQDFNSVMIGQNIGIGSSATHRARHTSNVFIGSDIAAATKFADAIIQNNVAIGNAAGQYLTSALGNALIGFLAGRNITSGDYNVFLGNQAGDITTIGSNNISIGHLSDPSSSSVSNTITLGNSSITVLRCQVTSITSLSDKRDKTNIKQSTYGLNVINKLNPVTFDWNMRDGGKIGDKDLGFIAQELQEVDDENLNLVYDENPEKLEASYGRLIPVMTKAIQELSAKIEKLELKIEILENQ